MRCKTFTCVISKDANQGEEQDAQNVMEHFCLSKDADCFVKLHTVEK